MSQQTNIEVVRAYYDSQNWTYDFEEEKGIFTMRMSMKDMDSCRVLTHCKENSDILTLAFLPIKISEAKRMEVAEYITRANYGMNIGNFEMDMSDGEVRYKVSSAWGDIEPTVPVMERLVDMSFVMLDKYASGILAVIYGGKSPEDAVAEVEKED